MTLRDNAWLRAQQARWLRPDAHRWVREDAARFLKPGVSPTDAFPALDRKYSPNQPRVPAGSPEGGRWTSEGGGGGSAYLDAVYAEPLNQPINDSRVISDAEPDNFWKPGAQLASADEPTPPKDPFPVVPEQKPPKSKDTTAILRSIAGWMFRNPAPAKMALSAAIEGAQWLKEKQYEAEIEAALDPPKSLEELQEAVDHYRLGTERHHIVEQTAAKRSDTQRARSMTRAISCVFRRLSTTRFLGGT